MIARKDRGIWPGEVGLEKALGTLRAFFQFNKRIPRTRDLPSIYSALKRGTWRSNGVMKWEDLLRMADFPIQKRGRSIKVRWEGEKGLNFARDIAVNYYNEHNRSPRTKDLGGIYSAIYAKYWVSYGIRTWNEFLDFCGLPQNRGNKWQGASGLNLAIQTFKDFKRRNNRVPTILDLKAIFSKINEGIWAQYDIFTWNDFVNNSEDGSHFVETDTSLKLHISELDF